MEKYVFGIQDNGQQCFNDYELPFPPRLGDVVDFGVIELPLLVVDEVLLRPTQRVKAIFFLKALSFEDGLTKDLDPGALHEYLLNVKRWKIKP